MKTSYKFLPAFLAAGLPASLATELIGFNLPASLEAPSMFCALIVTLLAQVAISDYTRPTRFNTDPATMRSPKADHPLAA
jgi:hypothetical protein